MGDRGTGSAGSSVECAPWLRASRCANVHTMNVPVMADRSRLTEAAGCQVVPGTGSHCRELQSERSRVLCRHYFSCISFVTDFTPGTALATLTAPLISSRELTKPLN